MHLYVKIELPPDDVLFTWLQEVDLGGPHGNQGANRLSASSTSSGHSSHLAHASVLQSRPGPPVGDNEGPPRHFHELREASQIFLLAPTCL